MIISSTALNIGRSFPRSRVAGLREPRSYEALTAELHAALAREQVLFDEKVTLSQRHLMMAEEFEHRLVNGLQSIVGLLSMQSRVAATPEAADQLKVAARRVSALACVHRRLHLLDHDEHVEFGAYLRNLCADLSNLLFQKTDHCVVVVEGMKVELPTNLAIPLGFITNELITNSAKYSEGNITVRIQATSPTERSLSVMDDGPGLPAGFEPGNSRGLGMKIVASLVKQIGGELCVSPGNNGRGTEFLVKF